jgi:NAD(P)H-dependent FMN reductase
MTHQPPLQTAQHIRLGSARPASPIPPATDPLRQGQRLRLTVMIGSARQGRFGPTVASWATEQIRRLGQVELHTVDIADYLAMDHKTEAALGARLSEADAFLVVVPEYNHSFPGELKTLIDRFQHQWARKPVGFVSYGGLSGGLRAVEQLRLVFIELASAPIRDTVSFHGAQSAFDADGYPHDCKGAAQALERLLKHLGWWATALRNARVPQSA